MVANADAAFSSGNLPREVRKLKDRVSVLETARTLESASIGAGGLRVLDGFIVILDSAGNEQMRLSTDGLTMEGLLSVIGAILVTGGGDITVDDGGAFVALDGSRIVAQYDDGSEAVKWGSLVLQGTETPDGHGLLIQDNVAGGNEDIFRAKRELDGDLAVVAGSSAQNVDFFQAGTNSMTLVSDTAIPIAIGLNTTDVIISTDSTTGSAANMHLDGTTQGIVSRVTSARRFKQDIRDLQVNPRTILDLKPKAWRDKGEIKRDPNTDRWHVGYIAEELDEIGLGAFVDYDEHGNPDSIEYDRLIVPLVEQVKALTKWAESQGFRQEAAAPTDLPKRVRSADGEKLKFFDQNKDRSAPRRPSK